MPLQRKDIPPRRPQADDTVARVMELWPATVGVFLRRRMACPGCLMAGFMTVREAAGSYDLDPDALLDDLRRAAQDEAAPAHRPQSLVRSLPIPASPDHAAGTPSHGAGRS